MDTIIQHVEHDFENFTEREFNAVDSLILSKLSYIRFESIVPLLTDKSKSVRLTDLLKAEMYESMFRYLYDAETHLKFLYALAASPRFRDTQMNFYIDNSDPIIEKQFSAVTFLLGDNTAYIAYRGTDLTLIGWKEDFNMAYISPVPSQEAAVKYINAVSKLIPRTKKIRIGGHSKGGNLAVYSVIKCDLSVQQRIINVYNHDGPGFKEDLFDSPEFLRIKNRIHTTLPESSLVGMLLQQHEGYSVIKSNQRGIKQHEPFSWIVENNDFGYTYQIKSGAMLRSQTLNEWLNTLTDEKRKTIIDVLFDVLEKTQINSLNELSEEWQKSATAMLHAIKNIDAETRKFVFKTISELAKLSFKNLFKPKDNA